MTLDHAQYHHHAAAFIEAFIGIAAYALIMNRRSGGSDSFLINEATLKISSIRCAFDFVITIPLNASLFLYGL